MTPRNGKTFPFWARKTETRSASGAPARPCPGASMGVSSRPHGARGQALRTLPWTEKVDQFLQVRRSMLPPRAARSGFTLLELLVVLAIVLIAALIGAGTVQPYLPRFRMVSTAKSFRADLRMLQSLALQTGRQTRLRLVSSGGCDDPDSWGGGWVMELGDKSVNSGSWDILPPDALADGVDDDQSQGRVDLGPDGAQRARGICMQPWDTIDGPGADNENSLVFTPRGSLANPVTDFPDGYIRLTFTNQYAARQGVVDEMEVMVSAAGWSGLQSNLGAEVGEGTVGASLSSTKN